MTAEPVSTPCLEYRGALNRAGYARVTRHGRRVMLHRWVVEQVEGPLLPWPDEVVMHLCDNPPCFRYDHLRRATCRDNIVDADEKGRRRRRRGAAHPNAKLTDEDVAAIREGLALGQPQRQLAALFGVSRTLVRKIGSGEHRMSRADHGRGREQPHAAREVWGSGRITDVFGEVDGPGLTLPPSEGQP